MIKIDHLVKRYGNKNVVDDVSVVIEEGEIVGFLGPNGAGKSTTMNILTGYLSATAGSAQIDGFDILEDALEAKKLIGYLPEQPPLYNDMTVKDYLNFIYELRHCTLNRRKHLEEIVQVTKIADVYHRVIGNLSKGYKQRVGIAQALVGNPPVIILDEPTVGLDPKQIVEIRNLIRTLGQDHTVILSTHILSEVQAVCDRIIVINKGRIVADKRTEDIASAVEGNRRYSLRVCGPQKDVQSAIRSVHGVRSVECIGQQDLDSMTYVIETEDSLDIRKPLFYAMSKGGWPIIGLEAMGANLEDVFLALLDRGGDRNGKNGGRS